MPPAALGARRQGFPKLEFRVSEKRGYVIVCRRTYPNNTNRPPWPVACRYSKVLRSVRTAAESRDPTPITLSAAN